MALVASEREALQIIQELVNAKPEAIGKEMGFSPEYISVLCRSLRQGNFIRGTALTGYEVTPKGEEFLAKLKQGRNKNSKIK